MDNLPSRTPSWIGGRIAGQTGTEQVGPISPGAPSLREDADDESLNHHPIVLKLPDPAPALVLRGRYIVLSMTESPWFASLLPLLNGSPRISTTSRLRRPRR